MRVRIIKAIPTARLEGFDVSGYRKGMVCDTGRSLCEVLFAYGYAIPEEGVATTVSSGTTDHADDRRRRARTTRR
jgi:hypothetical protein